MLQLNVTKMFETYAEIHLTDRPSITGTAYFHYNSEDGLTIRQLELGNNSRIVRDQALEKFDLEDLLYQLESAFDYVSYQEQIELANADFDIER